MKTLITTLALVATVTFADARPKTNYTPVVEISGLHPYARLDAYRQYRIDQRAESRAKAAKAKEKAIAKQLAGTEKPIVTAESLFAAKMAERHGTK